MSDGTRRGKGFDIRVQREGSQWRNEKVQGWGYDGALPEVWEEICTDPTVISARMSPGYQKAWRADKRHIIDEYQRPS